MKTRQSRLKVDNLDLRQGTCQEGPLVLTHRHCKPSSGTYGLKIGHLFANEELKIEATATPWTQPKNSKEPQIKASRCQCIKILSKRQTRRTKPRPNLNTVNSRGQKQSRRSRNKDFYPKQRKEETRRLYLRLAHPICTWNHRNRSQPTQINSEQAETNNQIQRTPTKTISYKSRWRNQREEQHRCSRKFHLRRCKLNWVKKIKHTFHKWL